MDDVTREIRQMLLGNLETRGKYLAVSANKLRAVRNGFTDGADRIFLFGVMRHTKYYTSELNAHKIKEAAHKSMMDIGRKVLLDSNPNAEVVICRYMITKPIVLLFEVDDIGIKVQSFTARGIGGLLSELWIRSKFMRGMPDNMKLMSKEAYLARKKAADAKRAEEERQEREDRKAEREERKAEREERKAEREERKAEREEQEKEERRQKAAEKEREKALKKRNKYSGKDEEMQDSLENHSRRTYNDNILDEYDDDYDYDLEDEDSGETADVIEEEDSGETADVIADGENNQAYSNDDVYGDNFDD